MSGHAVFKARNEALFCSLVVRRQQQRQQIQVFHVLAKYLTEVVVGRVCSGVGFRVRCFFDNGDFHKLQSQVVLRISGRISEQDVETVRASLEQERGMVAAIDLKDVLIVDGRP